jgi:hypothetical protein
MRGLLRFRRLFILVLLAASVTLAACPGNSEDGGHYDPPSITAANP